ncbi:hypothetical protein ABW19_dt0204431 [Dactylella cylindrospora]|nr:hypothetical protein ABW19_dt0204431 [Dactylella cylindrospora]
MPKVPASEAHITAPRSVRDLQKYYQKLPTEFLASTTQILDLRDVSENPTNYGDSLKVVYTISKDLLEEVYKAFLGDKAGICIEDLRDVEVYEHEALPGLRILPRLLPISVQELLLEKLLLRDLSNPEHLTNIHLHYNVPYPEQSKSFFELSKSTVFDPKEPDVHKALSIVDVLEKKLRWMTLGGQYDWTTKEYPDGPPVQFPKDIRDLVHGIFPTIEPEAAICNTYSPGDTLSPHRDVSEEADKDLVSISIGCDALFLISLAREDTGSPAPDPSPKATAMDAPKPQPRKQNRKKVEPPPPPPPLDKETLIIRIRSGDAVVMGGKSRWAWHGVPKVIADTCPEELTQWPQLPPSDDLNEVEKVNWNGWMKRKRVNLNIRQMYEQY